MVLVRRRQRHGRVRRAGAWEPVAVVDDADVAAAMAELLAEADEDVEVRTVTPAGLLRELGVEDRERVKELLGNPTTAAREQADSLRREAVARLVATRDRRTGRDRRSGRDRRRTTIRPVGEERRSGRDRRTGRDRRSAVRAVLA